MTSNGAFPNNVHRALKQLRADRIDDIQRIRTNLIGVAALGTPLLPEFTLHNATHADNLILLLGQLSKEFGLKLSGYESFLLSAAAYTHDLGMFFDGARFQQQILLNPKATLSFCPSNQCDSVERYRLFGRSLDAQIRETHSLLSAYTLNQKEPHIDGMTIDDRPYLMALSRAHRKVILRESGCQCYRTTRHAGEDIRMGVLASLLRMVDAMDFYSNRAPVEILTNKAVTFLENPVSLAHWLKHYFVQDPHVTRANHGGNMCLDCVVYFSVPPKQINGSSYADFFRPLFEEHIRKTEEADLNIDNYPPDVAIALGVSRFNLKIEEQVLAGARTLPTDIEQAIVNSGCANAIEFLDQLQPALLREPVANTKIPPQPMLIVDDNTWFAEELRSTFKKEGYQCEIAQTLEEAKKKLQELPFVLILDLKLHSEVKSWKVLARAAAGQSIPVIVVTGYPSLEAANEAVGKFGVIYFFSKGNLDNLPAKVAEAARDYWVKEKRLTRKGRLDLLEKTLGLLPI